MTQAACRLNASLLFLVLVTAGAAQTPATSGDLQRLIDTANSGSQLMANLEYLSDVIGPRLTGSSNLRNADDWAMQKMREYGLENVHLEEQTIPVGWQRGTLEMRLVQPRDAWLSAASAAWMPGTRGTVTGPVVLFDPADDTDMKERFHDKLRNAVVLMSRPGVVREHLVPPPATGTDEVEASAEMQRQNASRTEFLKEEGVAAVLRDSGKPQMLLNMTGSWPIAPTARGAKPERVADRIPSLFVAHEHIAMLYRLLQRTGMPVTVRLKITSSVTKGPVNVYNAVGEIRGSDKADEVVICGAHLDSWDLGTGSVDNGTGSTVVLETARILRAAGVKPRRTIRFVLFYGEEEGLYGSREYVRKHKAEMAKVSAVFVHDIGTGKVTGIGLHGNPQDRPFFEGDVPVLKDLGVTRYSTFLMGGTDHASFYADGVPAFWFMQDSASYDLMHHSQSDTFDKAIGPDLVQGATVMAICAYSVAQRDEMLPRRSATPAP